MINYLLLCKTEWKLLSRGPGLWILAAVAAGAAYLAVLTTEGTQNPYTYVRQFSVIYSGLLSIAALLSGINSARRDRQLKVDLLVAAMPYSTARVISARLAVTSLPVLALSLVPAFVFLVQNYRLSSRIDGEMMLAYAVLALAMLYPIMLGWLLAAYIRGWICYFAGFLVWVVHVYGGLMVLNALLPLSVYALLNFPLLDFASMGYLDETWGFMLDGTFWSHRAGYLALTVLGFMTITRLAAKRRKERQLSLFIHGIVAIAVIGAFGIYCFLRADRVANERLWIRQAESRLDELGPDRRENGNVNPQETASFQVNSYKLQVRQSASTALAISAELVLKQRDKQDGSSSGPVKNDVLDFTLHPQLKVTSAVLNGSPVSFSRDGFGLTLQPKAPSSVDGAVLKLEYEGKLDDWESVHPYGGIGNGTKLARSFRADLREWYLPGAAGWYPLPGKQLLSKQVKGYFATYSDWARSYPPLPAARFHVTVDAAPGLDISSNGQELSVTTKSGRKLTELSGTMSGFALVAGPLVEIKETEDSSLKLLVNRNADKNSISGRLNLYAKDMKVIDTALGIGPSDPLLILPIDASSGRGGSQLGGMMLLYDPLIYITEEEVTQRHQFMNFYLDYLLSSYPYSGGLRSAVIEYMRKEGIALERLPASSVRKLGGPEAYIAAHTAEEARTLLQNMYRAIIANPSQPPVVDDIMK